MNKPSFFIVGQHAVIEALKNPLRKVLRVFLTEESKKNIHRKNSKKNLLKDVKVYFKTKKELDKYTTKENLLHQGYVAEIEHLEKPILKEFIKQKENLTLVCLDGVTDPRNIGAIIRSAKAFNIDGLIIKEKNNITLVCLDEVTDPRNIGAIIRSAVSFDIDGIIVKERQFPDDSKLMYKAASGAIEYVNIFQVSNINSTLKNLRESNFWVYGFDGKAKKEFSSIDWKGNNVLLFGSEGFGMHQHTSKYADFLVRINIDQKIESLNISNSAAIVFHHLCYLKKKS